VFGNDEEGTSVYLTYDVKSTPKKKAPVVKKLSASAKSTRPGSAASASRRGLNSGSASQVVSSGSSARRSRDLLASATSGSGRKSNQSLAEKGDAPKERGLVGKSKQRYA
jgi:hypothetical protein